MQFRTFPVVTLVVCFVAACPPGWGQSDTGRLQGTVIDPSGAAIPNAAVTVSSVETGRQYRTRTEATNGSFVVSALPVGRYRIVGQAPRFKKYTQMARIDPGQVENAKITLQTGLSIRNGPGVVHLPAKSAEIFASGL